MQLWTESKVMSYFEGGGVLTRDGVLATLGVCRPNAPIPDVPEPDISDGDGTGEAAACAPSSSDGTGKAAVCAPSSSDGGEAAACVPTEAATAATRLPGCGRVYCVSDLHTDNEANMEWCRGLGDGRFRQDVLVIAGDVTSSLVLLEETLSILVKAFSSVFYVPGNHDLWVKGRHNGGLHIRRDPVDSLGKLKEIWQLCERLGVHTRPAYAGGAICAPLYAWYHATWDTEPEVIGWEGAAPDGEVVLMDWHMCTWPEPLQKAGASIAERLDAINDEVCPNGSLLEHVAALRTEYPGAPLITFSHFVPRLELSPEKRFLFYPPLSKATGSVYLRARVDALRPAVHAFGHTHFGWDQTLDGVRYLQAPLSYPDERAQRLGTVATGDAFPHGAPPTNAPTPLLAYDARTGTYPKRYDAGWSNWYARYPRRPDLNHLVPPYVARAYKQVPGVGEIGWLSPNDNLKAEAHGTPTPAWALGPSSAVRTEKVQRRGK